MGAAAGAGEPHAYARCTRPAGSTATAGDPSAIADAAGDVALTTPLAATATSP
jgi:hypothetical protein